MNLSRWLAVLVFIALVLAGAYSSIDLSPPRSLPQARSLIVLLVERMSVAELETYASVFKEGTVGMMPTRAGRKGEQWDIVSTIKTGSRSPVSAQAPRLGSVLREAGISVVVQGEIAAKLLDTPSTKAPGTLSTHTGCVFMSVPDASSANDTVKKLLEQLPQKGAILLVALRTGQAEESRRENLAPVVYLQKPDPERMMARGEGYGEPLASSSTHRLGLVASTDIASTIARLCGLDIRIGAGQPIGYWVGESGQVLPWLQEWADCWAAQARAQRFLKFVPWVLAAMFLLAAWRRWIWLKHFAMAYPLGLLIVPVLGIREAWIYTVAALVAGGIAALGVQGIKGAAWATVLIVVLDVGLGGWVSARTPLSYSPLEAARFYGIGNEIEGYLIGAALIAGAGDVVVTVLLGVVVSVVLGAPMLGADFGGFLTSIVTFFVATLVLAKKEERRVAAVALLVLAVLGTFLLLRSSANTHVGRAASGGGEGRGIVIARKLAMNAHLTLTSPWALLALVQVALLWRQKKNPALLAGAGSVWVLNDSGIVAAALLLLWHEKAPDAVRASRAASQVA